jgi:hypothetical protein
VHVTQPLVPQQSFNKVGVCILNLIALWWWNKKDEMDGAFSMHREDENAYKICQKM